MHKVPGNYISCTCRAVKIYVAAMEALWKKQRQGSKQDETQFGTKCGAFLSLNFDPPLEG